MFRKITTFIFIYTLIPNMSFAQSDNYEPLTDYGKIVGESIKDLPSLFNTIITIMIGAAAIIATIYIIWGGIQYMTSDAIGGKEGAKKRISAAIGGLILALSSYLILNTINPNLVRIDLKIKNVGVKDPNQINVILGGHDPVGDDNFEDIHHDSLKREPWSPNISGGKAENNNIYSSVNGWPGVHLDPNDMRTRSGEIKAYGSLINAFDTMVGLYGSDIEVVSGYRDHNHNDSVGGASNSQHVHGKAVDLKVSGLSVAQRKKLLISALDAGFTGIGLGETKMHVDTRDDKAWWGYIGGTSSGGGTIPDWSKPILKSYGYNLNK